MPERSSYEPGTPSWVDIGTDVAGAKAFYCPLFEWEATDGGPDAGGYGLFSRGGRQVAGYGPQQNPGPPYWSTYISVADADETAVRVAGAGGTTFVAPMDVFDAGRMAVFGDPTGGVFSVWQPGAHAGAQLVNEPGGFCWNEMNTRDPEAALAFYRAVFPWDARTSGGGTSYYTELLLDGRAVAGMMDMRGRVPDEVPAHWLVYFAVEDCDATLARATELGGSVVVPALDLPVGRFGLIRDPQGAALAVIRLNAARS